MSNTNFEEEAEYLKELLEHIKVLSTGVRLEMTHLGRGRIKCIITGPSGMEEMVARLAADAVARICERIEMKFALTESGEELLGKDQNKAMEVARRITEAVGVARYGQIYGGHHRLWVIDQMLRKLLTDEDYLAFVEDFEQGGEYEWEEGIPP